MKSKILLVEDEEAIRRGLMDLLVFKGYAPTAAIDGQQGEHLIRSQSFSLMLLDVMLPHKSGFELCAIARSLYPSVGIIMLTAKGEESDIVKGFEAGCDDYITKPFSLSQLLLRIAALERRVQLNTPKSTSGFALEPQTLRVLYQDREISVSKRDMEVLCHLYRAKDRIVERSELLSAVWGYRLAKDVETRCVDMQLVKLRRKLKVLALPKELIETVRGVGYRLREPV